MARPPKETVDYFTHDADASDSRTLTILENHYGAEGYATWFKLLERISKTRNHVIVCRNGEDTEFLAAKLKMQPERLEMILEKMAELGAIDTQLWKYKVIWCQNLVDRLKMVYDNRKQLLPRKPSISTDGNLINTTDNPLTIPEIRQTKLKETKLKETKEKRQFLERKQKEFSEYVEKLRSQYNDLDYDKELKKFNLYWSEGGRKLQRPKLALTNWMDKAMEFKNNKLPPTPKGKYSHMVQK